MHTPGKSELSWEVRCLAAQHPVQAAGPAPSPQLSARKPRANSLLCAQRESSHRTNKHLPETKAQQETRANVRSGYLWAGPDLPSSLQEGLPPFSIKHQT